MTLYFVWDSRGGLLKSFFLQYRAMVSDVTVHLGREEQVEFHGSTDEADWRVTLVDTGEKAETGARVWNARRYLEDTEHFCLTYGDGVGDVDITTLLEEHAASDKVAMLTGVRPEGRFGELDIAGDLVEHFNEKPNALSGYINGGFMVFDTKAALPYFRAGNDLNLEREVLPAMVRDRQLAVHQHNGFWQCMDTMREYKLLNDMWASGQASWKTW